MPFTERQRRAAFAALARKKAGGGDTGPFSGMSISKLTDYAHSPLEKKRKGSTMSARAQAAALRSGG